tara:strand:+ start:1892 stop:2095 length:204 start_codon:yes stop_codon:yes gene_type:complete
MNIININKTFNVIIEMILNLIDTRIKTVTKISIIMGKPNEAKAKNKARLKKSLNIKFIKIIFIINCI